MAKALKRSWVDKLEVPEYAQARLLDNVPGVHGWVFESAINGFIHLVDEPEGTFIEHRWFNAISFDQQPNKAQLQKCVDELPHLLKATKNFYMEYDYDEEGNQIPDSDRKIYFDKWILIEDGKVTHKGEPHGE